MKTLRRLITRLFLFSLMLALLQYSSFIPGLQWNAVAVLAGNYQFDYVTWELNALGVKIDQTLYGLHPFLTEESRIAIVRQYMDDLRAAQSLDAQINTLFADPTITDPEAASADLRTQRDALRADLRERQPLVEGILEGQVATVLVDEGFSLAGQILPPVSAHFTQVPNLLVVSPRDQIRFDISINLDPMTVDQITAMEDAIDREQDVSSLIVPLGGIALYPAMVLETASIPQALDTIAHEWLHHYLFFFPLGLQYFNGESFVGEARIINETTASLFGREMSRLVLAKYYPDLLPSPPPSDSATSPSPSPPPSPPAFDFGAELDRTRRRVDELLTAGKIEEAEAYMEEQREVFLQNGYLIRKLNQAFFAFYGGYQSGAPGAGGQDPIGPAVQTVRDNSPSLHDWVITMRGITTRDGLLAAAANQSD
ncbi:MAG: hypothetical protein K8L97_12215 [Anaerolineae bacterium]|nr:hypothetical protein [Anaerolineae bacterium]